MCKIESCKNKVYSTKTGLCRKHHTETKNDRAIKSETVVNVKEVVYHSNDNSDKPDEKHDSFMYDLCIIISQNWFKQRENLWQLAGVCYQMPEDRELMLRTYCQILTKKLHRFDVDEATSTFNSWKDSKYPCKLTILTLKSIAAGTDQDAYKEWKDKYEPEPIIQKTKKSNQTQLTESEAFEKVFDKVFESARIVDDIKKLLSGMSRTFDEFKDAMCDNTFNADELSYWADKYCTIRNQATNSFTLNYNHFEKLLKQIVFRGELSSRFVCYFIHEFFVFGIKSSHCYMRKKVCELNSSPVESFSISEFKNTQIKSLVQIIPGQIKLCTTSLFDLIKGLPYHKFTNRCHLWNHDSSDLDVFSMALPFQYTPLDDDVDESDLVQDLMYYLKSIICNNDEQSWIWLRSYLANMIYQPDARIEVMLVLYSREKRLGKSTLYYLIQKIFGECNIGKVDSISDAFGERGGTTLVGKKVAWFEELTDKKATFRACMDRMKTGITERRTTYRPLYQEVNETNNTNEYIACTNHLVGVLEDRMTVLQVSDERKDDHAFYSKFRAAMTQAEVNKFVAYLKPYTTPLPMKCHKTDIYNSMVSNGREPIETFVREIKSGQTYLDFQKKAKFWYCTKNYLYDCVYRAWSESNSEKIISFAHFKEKLNHYDRDCSYKRVRIDNELIYAFVFSVDWQITEE